MSDFFPTDTTTASTLSFALWELAKSPVTQRRVRDEVLTAKHIILENTGIDEIPFSYYEKMPLLVALIKVSRTATYGDKCKLTVWCAGDSQDTSGRIHGSEASAGR